LAATLCAGTPDNGFKIEDDKSYAEMWMGDYVRHCFAAHPRLLTLPKPVLPAKDLTTGEGLHKIIDEHKEKLLGRKVTEKFDGVLPFLPKVDDNRTGPQNANADCSLDFVDSKGTPIADPPE